MRSTSLFESGNAAPTTGPQDVTPSLPIANRKRILFLSPFFAPELISTGKYNSRVCEALRDAGHSVTVVTSYPLYPDWIPRRVARPVDGIDVRRGGLWLRYPRHPVPRRIVLELWFAVHCLIHTFRQRNAIDQVIAVLPPSVFPLLIRAVLPGRVPMIGIVHDLQGVMAESAKSPLRWLVARIMRRLEALSLRCFDKIVCLSRSMRKELTDGYGADPARIRMHYPFLTIRNEPHGDQLRDLFPEHLVHVVYSGALGEKQMPDRLLAFFEHLSATRPDIRCHLFSRGPAFERLRAKRQAGPGERVQFHDLVPEEALEELYARSDVQVIPQAPGTESGAFPSKLPNLIASGVPLFVISSEVSEIAAIIEEANAGTVVGGTDIAAWTEAMHRLLADLKARPRKERRAAAAEYVERHFNIEALLADLAD
jgi:colanic acid biosynthesis glycosyl transferase WcaI